MHMLNYNDLFTSFKKGLGNGNWRHLKIRDKALYRAAMEYAKQNERRCVGERNTGGEARRAYREAQGDEGYENL